MVGSKVKEMVEHNRSHKLILLTLEHCWLYQSEVNYMKIKRAPFWYQERVPQILKIYVNSKHKLFTIKISSSRTHHLPHPSNSSEEKLLPINNLQAPAHPPAKAASAKTTHHSNSLTHVMKDFFWTRGYKLWKSWQ